MAWSFLLFGFDGLRMQPSGLRRAVGEKGSKAWEPRDRNHAQLQRKKASMARPHPLIRARGGSPKTWDVRQTFPKNHLTLFVILFRLRNDPIAIFCMNVTDDYDRIPLNN